MSFPPPQIKTALRVARNRGLYRPKIVLCQRFRKVGRGGGGPQLLCPVQTVPSGGGGGARIWNFMWNGTERRA